MLRRKRHLIVPIRDRRQHRRIMTLKNFAKAMLVAIAAFVAVTIYSETRAPRPGDYGRLYSRELPKSVESKPMERVVEAAVPAGGAVASHDDGVVVSNDQTHADPMLVEPLARAQWLGIEGNPAPVASPPARTMTSARIEHGRITISGGPEGVTIVRSERSQPLLRGGFGR
jgi:hypothetical protein